MFDAVLLISCFSRQFYKKSVSIKIVSILYHLFHRSFIELSFWGLNLEFYRNKESIHLFQKPKNANRGSKWPLLKLDLQGEDQSYTNYLVDILTVENKYLCFQFIICGTQMYRSKNEHLNNRKHAYIWLKNSLSCSFIYKVMANCMPILLSVVWASRTNHVF